MNRRDREGMILLNVLLVMAVASVAVLVMIVAQDIQVQRGTRLRDAAQASAYARAGELSAVTVLRRDALTAAASDNLTEPWAQIGQEAIAVPGGRFSASSAGGDCTAGARTMMRHTTNAAIRACTAALCTKSIGSPQRVISVDAIIGPAIAPMQ